MNWRYINNSHFPSELPSYDEVIPALLEVGIDGLRQNCKLTPGVPLKPMLAKPTKAIGEVLDRFEDKKFTCEYKYDGERAQVGDFGVNHSNKRSSDLIDHLGPQVAEWQCFCVQSELRRHEQKVPGFSRPVA